MPGSPITVIHSYGTPCASGRPRLLTPEFQLHWLFFFSFCWAFQLFCLKFSQSVFSQSIEHKQQLSLPWSSFHKHQANQHQLSPSAPHCTPLFCTPLSILALTEHFSHFPLPTTIVATSSSFLWDILRRLVSVVSLKHNSTPGMDELPLGALGSCCSSVHSEMKWHVPSSRSYPSNKLQGLDEVTCKIPVLSTLIWFLKRRMFYGQRKPKWMQTHLKSRCPSPHAFRKRAWSYTRQSKEQLMYFLPVAKVQY